MFQLVTSMTVDSCAVTFSDFERRHQKGAGNMASKRYVEIITAQRAAITHGVVAYAASRSPRADKIYEFEKREMGVTEVQQSTAREPWMRDTCRPPAFLRGH